MSEFAAYSAVAMTLGLVVARPRLSDTFRITPAMAAVLGTIFLLLIQAVKPEHFLYALGNLWSPFVVIASVMVMTYVADHIGLLQCWASHMESKATSPQKLFFLVFALGVMTSSILNNDAAILVLTPLVLTMVKRRYPNRPGMLVPFAFAVFMSAGVAALPVSNPMNMVVAEFSGIDFNTYAKHMIPVAVAGWVIAYILLRLIFSKQLMTSVRPAEASISSFTSAQKWMMVLLLSVLLSYPITGYLGGHVWPVALFGAIFSIMIAKNAGAAIPLKDVLSRGICWETLVFLLAVLVMSLGLRDVGLVDRLVALYQGSGLATIGITSAIGSALLNNHPMSHLNMMALEAVQPNLNLNVFAALVGGDLGPRLLPMGSLAGLIWLEQLRRYDVHVSVGYFFKIGLLLAVPTIAVSLAILSLY